MENTLNNFVVVNQSDNAIYKTVEENKGMISNFEALIKEVLSKLYTSAPLLLVPKNEAEYYIASGISKPLPPSSTYFCTISLSKSEYLHSSHL